MPIPTYYGDEICYVNGLAYARDVTARRGAPLGPAQGFGGGVWRRPTPTTYALKPRATARTPSCCAGCASARRRRVLDVGLLDGRFADLARRQGHHVTGRGPSRSRRGRRAGRRLHRGRPQRSGSRRRCTGVRRGGGRRHARARRRARTPARRAGAGPAAGRRDPGVACRTSGTGTPAAGPRSGKFDYDQRGPLDRGHLRFFTRDSIEALIASLRPDDHRARHRRYAVRHAAGRVAHRGASGWRAPPPAATVPRRGSGPASSGTSSCTAWK